MISRWIYDFIIALFRFGLFIAAPFYAKARLMLKGRKGQWGILTNRLKKLNQERVWFHCASLGEFEQARPLIEALKKDKPNAAVIVTFYSPSGYQVRKNYKWADGIFYLPFDTKSNARRFVRLVKPTLAVFIKYEFWYHLLNELRIQNIPVLSVSAIFRENQLFFKSYGHLHREMLRCFKSIYVQNDASENLLEKIGITNTVVVGDTRFDRVSIIPAHADKITLVEKFGQGRKVFVVGSSWKEDIDILTSLMNDSSLDLAFIVAPHEISEANLRYIESKTDLLTVRFSAGGENEVDGYRVLIIDNIGMLSSLYQYANFAYVGGSFGEGLHNILEPATFGLPVLFGKNKSNSKYQEAMDMIRIGAGFEVENKYEVEAIVQKLLEDRDFYNEAAKKANAYIQSNTGATEKIMKDILEVIK